MLVVLRPLAAMLLTLSLAMTVQAQEKSKAGAHGHEADLPQKGICVLMPTEGNKAVGVLMLAGNKDGVHVTGKISGLTPGKHGFHIHQFGDLSSKDGASAGGHYNPDGHMHGGLEDAERHAGDLGNVTANEDGVATVDVQAKGLKLHFVLGRSFVVHAKADDLKSQPSGDAGGRVGVGVIGIAEVKAPAATPAAKTKK